MSTNPYKPTTTNLDVVEPELAVPEDIAKLIKSGWIAGLISIGITMIFILLSIFGTSIMGINAWGLIDVGLMAGLTYGVYRKSRTCAVLLLAFFVLSKIAMWVQAGSPSGWIMALIFAWYFFQGASGTFQYHRWKRDTFAGAA
jgi:serine/threonine-protein kinase